MQAQDPVIEVTNPKGGEVFLAGDTVYLKWIGENLTVDAVWIDFSPNSGTDLYAINTDGIHVSDTTWNNYPWELPAITSDEVTVGVHEYNSDAEHYSGLFSITEDPNDPRLTSVGTIGRKAIKLAPDNLIRTSANGQLRMLLPWQGKQQISIFDINGSKAGAYTLYGPKTVNLNTLIPSGKFAVIQIAKDDQFMVFTMPAPAK
ncbi:MAG: hypothetical protein GF398_02125 [Chitinivibrionales bacterium]|nr:hypothetical protein [Chitinivibrionales bacterium]